MTTKRSGKKLLRISSIILGILLVLLIGFHFWFKAHARHLIEDMVESKSNGKLKLKVERFNFNWFTKKMEFRKAVFYSTDSADANTSYSFQVDRIKLKVQAILPIVFKKRILIDTMTLLDPEIRVTRLKASDKKQNRDVSLPEEMGKVYNSIQDALKVLKVSRFLIANGRFTLINKIQPDQQPITISNLRFQIDNLQVDTTIRGAREKILFSDNVILQSHDQDIMFPDGRHRLSFSRFKINLQNKLVEFDSCTIAATRTDSSSASFSIFLDALKLIDIDFDTLYKHEVIKADSVYCVNPTFNLEVEVGKKRADGKAPPKLENIIKQLTGDMQLGFVVVNNADFNIRTIRNGVPSSFTSTGNNFEMQGLTIDQQLEKPLKVKSFVMAIRNYENFLRDSTYSVQFDSVLFREDRIYLSNFLFNKLDNGKIVNTFNIPQFYLGGLSWDDLVFEKKLKAEQATMFNPFISYTVSDKFRNKAGRQNIFQSLSAVNDYMDLEYLDIIDGTIDLKVNKDVRVQLEEATLSIQSHNLLTSTKLAGIKNSLTHLDFKKGIIRVGKLTMDLKNIHYLGKSGKFGADQILVTEKDKKVAIILNGVSVEKMIVDELTGNIFSEDIKWQNGEINITGANKGGDMNSLLELKRVSGQNTLFKGRFGDNVITTKLDHISFDQLDKKPGEKFLIKGLAANGRQFQLQGTHSLLSAASYSFIDKVRAGLQDVSFREKSEKADIDIKMPSVAWIPYIQPMLDGQLQLEAVKMDKPVITVHLAGRGENKTKLPGLDISDLILVQPHLLFSQTSDSGVLKLEWNGSDPAARLQLTGLHITNEPRFKSSLKNIKFNIADLEIAYPNGKRFNTNDGKITAELRDISLEQKENRSWDWNAMVTDLEVRDFLLDSLGKNDGRLQVNSLNLKELGISSASIINMQKLAAANVAFELRRFNGGYSNTQSMFQWFNASLNRNNYLLTLDSFTYRPKPDKNSFMDKQAFQSDYLTVNTGAVRMGAVDIDTYIKDNSLQAGTLVVENATLTDFRDNTLPFRSGVRKNLPVKFLKNIPLQFSIDTVRFNNARVDYTQVGVKTREAGTIPVTRMKLELVNVKNFDISGTDSLDLFASGYVLDTAWIRLRVRQSYTDPLAGFLMTARFSPVDLSVFNPVVVPLVSVKIQSGFLDTANLYVIGFDSLAYGSMEMHYHDLKLKFLKDSDESQKSFSKSLMTFFANTIIRNKNDSRTGAVFQLRDTERSAINFLVKIAMSGFSSNVGIKNNRKQIRKYNKDADQKNFLPLSLD